jgi:hypothetical protein
MSGSFWRGSKGGATGSSFSLLAGVLRRPYSEGREYKRVHSKMSKADYLLRSAKAGRKRKYGITLPDRPFDYRSDT